MSNDNSNKTPSTTTTTTTTFPEPSTVISIDFTSGREEKRLEPTHFSCQCETCLENPSHRTDWTTHTGPLPEAA